MCVTETEEHGLQFFPLVCMTTDPYQFQNFSFLKYLGDLRHEICYLHIFKQRLLKHKNANS